MDDDNHNNNLYDVIYNFLSQIPNLYSLKNDTDITRDAKLKDNILLRDGYVTNLLNEFVSNHRVKHSNDRKLKTKVLWGILIALLIITITIIVAFVCFIRINIDIVVILSLLGVVISFLTSISFIIKMLLKYLFSLDTDKNIISLIATIIDHDLRQYEQLRNKKNNDTK